MGLIDLAKIQDIGIYEDPKSKKSSTSTVFFVRIPERSYYFQPETIDKRDEWIEAIRSKMGNGQNESQGSQEEVVEGADKFLSTIAYEPAGFLQSELSCKENPNTPSSYESSVCLGESFKEVLSVQVHVNPVRAFKMFFSNEAKPFLTSYHKGRNDTGNAPSHP